MIASTWTASTTPIPAFLGRHHHMDKLWRLKPSLDNWNISDSSHFCHLISWDLWGVCGNWEHFYCFVNYSKDWFGPNCCGSVASNHRHISYGRIRPDRGAQSITIKVMPVFPFLIPCLIGRSRPEHKPANLASVILLINVHHTDHCWSMEILVTQSIWFEWDWLAIRLIGWITGNRWQWLRLIGSRRFRTGKLLAANGRTANGANSSRAANREPRWLQMIIISGSERMWNYIYPDWELHLKSGHIMVGVSGAVLLFCAVHRCSGAKCPMHCHFARYLMRRSFGLLFIIIIIIIWRNSETAKHREC